MSYKVIKVNHFENFPDIWQHWAGDRLQGVFGIYDRYCFRDLLKGPFETKLCMYFGKRLAKD